MDPPIDRTGSVRELLQRLNYNVSEPWVDRTIELLIATGLYGFKLACQADIAWERARTEYLEKHPASDEST